MKYMIDGGDYANMVSNVAHDAMLSGVSPKTYELEILLKNSIADACTASLGEDEIDDATMLKHVHEEILKMTYPSAPGGSYERAVKLARHGDLRSVSLVYEELASK